MNRERKKLRIISDRGLKNHRSSAVRGGGATDAPPSMDPLVLRIV